jgi:hypothetical protein
MIPALPSKSLGRQAQPKSTKRFILYRLWM